MRDTAVGRETSPEPVDWNHLVTVVRSQYTGHRSNGLLVLIVLHIQQRTRLGLKQMPHNGEWTISVYNAVTC